MVKALVCHERTETPNLSPKIELNRVFMHALATCQAWAKSKCKNKELSVGLFVLL